MATFRGTVTGQIRIWNERKHGVDARELIPIVLLPMLLEMCDT